MAWNLLIARCIERKVKKVSKEKEKVLSQGLTTLFLVSYRSGEGCFPGICSLEAQGPPFPAGSRV